MSKIILTRDIGEVRDRIILENHIFNLEEGNEEYIKREMRVWKTA